jgi:hypothetical protein
MIYLWRCLLCGEDSEIERVLADIEMWPSVNETACGCNYDEIEWTRLIHGGHMMWGDARDRGVFPQRYKNYPELN